MAGPDVDAEGQAELVVTPEVVDDFAVLTTDKNKLHVDAEYAEATPFGERVAHGMLTASVVSAAITDLPGQQLLYLGQDLTFEAPVYVGDTVRATATVIEHRNDDRLLVGTTASTDDGPVLTGEARMVLMAD